MGLSWRLMRDIFAPAFFICWIAYFAYEAAVGATGMRVLRSVSAEVAARRAEVAALSAERRRLELTAAQLNPASLDPDMVDEKIRSVLGFAAEEDLVIPRDQLDEAIAKEDRR
ncbi:MAG: septum formation initiator family protein [Parvularculaceae bacterium]|nr:septum formation initiator family protein [Parvularculaceae bacterium]